jgi:hypothetical protein
MEAIISDNVTRVPWNDDKLGTRTLCAEWLRELGRFMLD